MVASGDFKISRWFVTFLFLEMMGVVLVTHLLSSLSEKQMLASCSTAEATFALTVMETFVGHCRVTDWHRLFA